MGVILEDFQKAIKRLEEVLKLSKTDINRDSAIKRFEICFDLSWKEIKAFARKKVVECQSPRDCIKTAFQLKLIAYDKKYLDMLKDRNLTAHIYKEELADLVYDNLKNYLQLFKTLAQNLEKEI